MSDKEERYNDPQLILQLMLEGAKDRAATCPDLEEEVTQILEVIAGYRSLTSQLSEVRRERDELDSEVKFKVEVIAGLLRDAKQSREAGAQSAFEMLAEEHRRLGFVEYRGIDARMTEWRKRNGKEVEK